MRRTLLLTIVARLLAVLLLTSAGVVGAAAGSSTQAAARAEAVEHVPAGDLRLGDLRIGLSSPSPTRKTSGADPLNCYDGWLQSVANNKYVSAELHYEGAGYGELRARASTVGSWERFEFCWGENQTAFNLSIRSLANGKWVSAELQYTGPLYAMLRARASRIGPWETFNAALGIRNTVNWKWVTAELQYTGIRYGMLRARADRYGPWEQFRNPGP